MQLYGRAADNYKDRRKKEQNMEKNQKHSTASQVASVVSLPGYKIIDVLGKGGMAVVYLAIQESVGRQVALKILAPDHSDDTFTDRFLREARIISSLAHPNIITVYDANVHQSCHYMSMEYVPGNSLRESRDKLTRQQKVEVIKQIAQALDYAGKKGYVHRDIKPENILLHEDGRAILTDFGIARSQDVTQGLTVTGKVIGTPYYMSPEQTKGMKVDHRSDIYSLGIVLFQALAEYLPYDGSSFVAIGIKHLSDPIPQLPKGLELFQPIINICLSKDPAHRYQTANELHQALEKINDADLDFIETKISATRKSPSKDHAKTIATGTMPPVVSARPKAKPSRYKQTEPTSTHDDHFDVTDTDDFKRLRRRKRWIFLFLLAGLAAGGYYKRVELKLYYQAEIAPTVDPILQPLLDKYIRNTAQQQPTENQATITTPQPELTSPGTTGIEVAEETETTIETGGLNTDVLALNTETSIREQLATQTPESIKQLTLSHRQALQANPDDPVAKSALQEISKWYVLQTHNAIENNDIALARLLIAQANSSLPLALVPQQLVVLENQLLRREAIQNHLQQVHQYMEAGALVVPAGHNAVDSLNAILSIDPDNANALQLLQDIATQYHDKAHKEFAAGKTHEALASIELGLTVQKDNAQLATLKQTVQQEISQQEKILSLLIQAEAKFQAGKAVEPKGENAIELYKAVLKEQPGNKKARAGARNVEDHAVKQIQAAIWENKLLIGQRILASAQHYFPVSPKLDQAARKLQLAMTSRAPRITHLIISDQSLTSLLTEQRNISVTPTIHLGFTYTNFSKETTILNVQVDSLDENVVLLNKKIIVSEKSGEHIFSVKHPQATFIRGQYRIIIKLENKELTNQPFVVQSSATPVSVTIQP